MFVYQKKIEIIDFRQLSGIFAQQSLLGALHVAENLTHDSKRRKFGSQTNQYAAVSTDARKTLPGRFYWPPFFHLKLFSKSDK